MRDEEESAVLLCLKGLVCLRVSFVVESFHLIVGNETHGARNYCLEYVEKE